jgi:histidyl-tRNA synthetase
MIQSIRGTKDLLPEFIGQWHFIEDIFKKVSDKYGYDELRTPIFEKTEVFHRSIGEATDIVNKEMYSFVDRGGESITLRPEGTASLVRAVIQNSLIQASSTLRLWYLGPFFRYERPQKGRLRQFHQYGAECIGSPYPEADAEIILLANEIFRSAGIKDYKLLLNSLGSEETRKNYRFALIEYLSSHKDDLSEDSQNRFEVNPLRILDSKSEKDKEILKNAPIILDFLDDESKKHFDTVVSILQKSDIDLEISPKLVRGLDYYCHTVFEFQSSALGAQDSIGGGGRYDGLFEQLGFKQKVPAVGFALGVERLLLVLEQTNSLPVLDGSPDIYLVSAVDDYSEIIVSLSEQLRKSAVKVVCDIQRRSVKAQLREANKMNCKYSAVIGENEITTNRILLKNMRNGEQVEILMSEIVNFDFS